MPGRCQCLSRPLPASLDQLFDAQVVHCAIYDDWHRVERAKLRFDLEAVDLQNAGWAQH